MGEIDTDGVVDIDGICETEELGEDEGVATGEELADIDGLVVIDGVVDRDGVGLVDAVAVGLGEGTEEEDGDDVGEGSREAVELGDGVVNATGVGVCKQDVEPVPHATSSPMPNAVLGEPSEATIALHEYISHISVPAQVQTYPPVAQVSTVHIPFPESRRHFPVVTPGAQLHCVTEKIHSAEEYLTHKLKKRRSVNRRAMFPL